MRLNEIVVYYSNKASIFINDPEPLFKNVMDLLKEKNSRQSKHFKRCPAFINHCENTFVVKNEMNYNLVWRENDFASSKLDQEYFSTWVKSREVDDGLVGYLHPSYIFAANESVTFSLLPPYMHDCDIAHKAIMLPGTYDVGSHIRPLEASMYIKNRNDVLTFKKGDPLYYIKFNTNKSIHRVQ